MANVVNRLTKEISLSVNTPDYSEDDFIINPDQIEDFIGIPIEYFDISGDSLIMKSQSDIDAIIAARIESGKRSIVKSSTISTTATTNIIMRGLEFVNPFPGNYAVLFSSCVGIDKLNETAYFSIYVDGIEDTSSIRFFTKLSAGNYMMTVQTQTVVIVNGSQNIDVRWRTSSDSSIITSHTRSLIITSI